MDFILSNLSIIGAFISIFPMFYWFLTRNHNYWTKRGIKGPWPVPGFGTTIYFMMNSRTSVEDEWFKRYGKIYGLFEGNKPVLRVADPELIKQILVKDFHLLADKHPANNNAVFNTTLADMNGTDWRRARSVLTPTFTTGKLKNMYPMVRKCLNDFMIVLEKLSINRENIDMKEMILKYTIDMIATCAYGTKADLYNDHDNIFYNNFKEFFRSLTSNSRMFLSMFFPDIVLKYFKLGIYSDSKGVKEYFRNIIKQIIKERKNSNKTYYDFIELLLNVEKTDNNVRDVEDLNDSHHVNEGEEEREVVKKTFSGVVKYITEEEIIANSFSFLTFGAQTMGSLISHCTQELALNSDVQQKLYTEVISSVDSKGEIDYDVLTQLPYLDAVVSEALRLHSIFFIIHRIASEDYKVGDTDVTLHKGQKVEIPIYAIHHAEKYYPNPDQFIPDRFLPENRDKIIPYTYIPFSGGPRNCVGMRLVLLLARMSLAHLVLHFKIENQINQNISTGFMKNFFIHTPESVIVKMVKRNK